MNEKPVIVYMWKDKRLGMSNPKVILKALPDTNYKSSENAKQLARFIMLSTPGNTLDILINSIRDEILTILNSNNSDLLQDEFYIPNLIRIALNNLAEFNQD